MEPIPDASGPSAARRSAATEDDTMTTASESTASAAHDGAASPGAHAPSIMLTRPSMPEMPRDQPRTPAQPTVQAAVPSPQPQPSSPQPDSAPTATPVASASPAASASDEAAAAAPPSPTRVAPPRNAQERSHLLEQKSTLKARIRDFKEGFAAQHGGREPRTDETPPAIVDAYRMYQELSRALGSGDTAAAEAVVKRTPAPAPAPESGDAGGETEAWPALIAEASSLAQQLLAGDTSDDVQARASRIYHSLKDQYHRWATQFAQREGRAPSQRELSVQPVRGLVLTIKQMKRVVK